MTRKGFVILAAFLLMLSLGCASYVSPKPEYTEAEYLEPLPASLMVSFGEIKEPPPGLGEKVGKLPPVLLMPGRNIYFHEQFYYYLREGRWYFGAERTGPWHSLPSGKYPPEAKRKGFEKQLEREGPTSGY
jgi:hypothetical protein